MIGKKSKILSLGLATAMMLGTSVSFAAEGDYYTQDGTKIYTNNQIRVDGTARNHVRVAPGEFKIEVNGELYNFTEAREAYAQDPDNWKEIVTGGEVVEGELKVESVSAINGKKLEVKFTQEVVKTGQAENTSKYTVTKKDGTSVTVNAATLSDNEKEVTLDLTTNAPLDGDYVVTVLPIQSKADTSKTTPLYTKELSFKDTVKPAVTGVTYPRAGVAEIQMSEEIDMTNASATIKRADGTALSGEAVAIDGNDASKFVANVKANVEYKVTLLGLKDMSGNIITPNPTVLTIKSTVVDNENPAVESMKAIDEDALEIVFSEGLQVVNSSDAFAKYAAITVGGAALTGGTQTFDADTNTLTVTGMQTGSSVAVTAGIKSVKVSGYKDLAGNAGDDVTKNIQFAAKTAKFEKTTVKADNSEVKLTFDTNVTKTATDIALTRVDSDMITTTFTVKNADITAAGGNKDFVLAPTTGNSSTANGFLPGKYTATLTQSDISELGSTDKVEISFEIKSAVDTQKATPTVGAIDAKNVVVTYDKDMGASALDVNNYKVEGKSVFKSAIFDGDAQTVKLTLKPETILLGGDYELTISSAVKTQAGVAIDAFASVETFEENVAPTVEKAELIGNDKIKVTFSEVIEDYTADPFEVYVDGVKVGLSTINAKASGGTDSHLDITLTSPLTDLSKPITVKVIKAAEIKDANGNELVTEGTYTVAK